MMGFTSANRFGHGIVDCKDRVFGAVLPHVLFVLPLDDGEGFPTELHSVSQWNLFQHCLCEWTDETILLFSKKRCAARESGDHC